MTVIALGGCRTTPLLSYLQGLGVLRLLHEQCDPEITAYWNGPALYIKGDLTRETITRFFVEDYKPTPILSPWNGGGGFRTLKHEKGEKAVAQIESSNDSRLATFRTAIREARQVWDMGRSNGWLEEKWEQKAGGKKKYILKIDKPTFLTACRSVLPDEAIDWLDASVVLTDAKKPQFPLLLGTGGNLGRLDLATTYMEALSVLLTPEQNNRNTELLAHALFGTGRPKLDSKAASQYSPAAAGTTNSSAFGPAKSVTNLWSLVLGMEGALLFSSGVARRFSGSQGLAITPFTVSGNPAGYSGAEGETVKGEFWAPLWERPMTVPELRRVIAEGRLSWRGKQAASGLDAAKALGTLGADRGLSRFERYVIAVRFGQTPLAAPVGSFVVERQPAERVSLLRTTDPWVDRVRRQKLPHAAGSAMRRVDTAQLEVTQNPNSPVHLQGFLVELAALEWIISRNPQLAEKIRRPIPPLDRKRWEPELDDVTVEWRLAVALATQNDSLSPNSSLADRSWGAASVLLRPVRLTKTYRKFYEWDNRAISRPYGSVTDRLAAVLVNRTVMCADRTPTTGVLTVGTGGLVAFDYARRVRAVDVADFLTCRVDDHRLNRLISAAALLDGPPRIELPEDHRLVAIDPARAVLAPFYHSHAVTTPATDESPEGQKVLLLPGRSWPQRLHAGQTSDVFREALVRLRTAGFKPAVRAEAISKSVPDPNRLLASLLIPTTTRDVQQGIHTICPPTIGERSP